MFDALGDDAPTAASQKQSQGEQYVRPKQTGLIRFGRRIRHPLNRFLGRQSLIGDDPIIKADLVRGLEDIAPQWEEMRDEIVPLIREREAIPPLGKISPDHRRIASTPAWKSFFLRGYGYDLLENQQRCPKIVKAIDSIPGVVVAFLSIMEPGTHVPQHRGLSKAWLNCHLPLMLPSDGARCEIAINGEIAQWREGEWLVFDETYPHEVWNMSSEPRVVLFLQIRRPMTLIGRVIAKLIYHTIRHSTFVSSIRKGVVAK